ncbi:MAG: hypothetical protein SV760_06690 [Halobacteria archaeon]|nr:hypothetical protein [Halobacteria archaeon]
MLLQTLPDVPFTRDVVRYVVSHPKQVAAIVVAVAGAVASYAKTGRVPIGRLPYRYLRRLLRDVGNTYFGKPRPTGVPAVVVDAPPDEVESAVRDRHYESGDLFSYEYAGEVWNLRRPEDPARNPETGAMTPMENHARAFRTADDRTLVLDHYEANRFEATEEHLDERGLFSWSKGRDILAEDLEAEQLSYETIASEADAKIEVVDSSS